MNETEAMMFQMLSNVWFETTYVRNLLIEFADKNPEVMKYMTPKVVTHANDMACKMVEEKIVELKAQYDIALAKKDEANKKKDISVIW